MRRQRKSFFTIIVLLIISVSLILPINLTHAPESEQAPNIDDHPKDLISSEKRLPPVTTKKKDHIKLESRLEQLVRGETESLTNLDSMTQEGGFNVKDKGTVQLVFELTRNATIDDLALLEERGAVIEITYKDLVQARIPLDLLYGILEIPFVRYIRTPAKPVPSVVSAGVGVINADDAHALGYKGSGVKVAVIDIGFDITNDEISGNIVEAVSFLNPPDLTNGGDSEHGTACAEIILDVAPEAQLYLYNVGTDIEFSSAVNRAISQGVDIISVSLGWYDTPSDGTGFLAEVIDNALSNGVLSVISAGNQAENHWEGAFRDDDLNGWHEFDGTDETNEFYAYAGDLIWITITWDDWPTSDQDFDLYLYDDTMSVVESSTTAQDGTQSPVEFIRMYAPSSGTYHIAIDNYYSTRNVNIDLHTSDSYIDYYVCSSSILDPGTANGAFTVGATHVADDSLEWYSSRGPTNDGRLKPDVVGPAQVYTSAYGYDTFGGTSAAAPHVAGAAAILLSSNNAYTADDLRQILESTALDLGEPGPDYSFGYGRINLNFSYLYDNRVIHVSGNYSTIQEAIDAANPNDTIVVEPGTYNENLFIAKDLTIQSSGGASATIIDGGGNGSSVYVSSSTVALRNFTIMNSGNVSGDAGVRLDSSPNSIVEHNKISNVRNGILVWYSENSSILLNTLHNVTYGINSIGSSNSLIELNNVSHAPFSILLQMTEKVTVSNNVILEGTYGIYSNQAWNCSLNDNYVENFTYDLFVFDGSLINVSASVLSNIHVNDNSTIYAMDSNLDHLYFYNESNAIIYTSSVSDLSCQNNSLVVLFNSTLDKLRCERFTGILYFNETQVRGAWNITNSSFFIGGRMNFTDVELSFENSSVIRYFNVYVTQEGGPAANMSLTLSDELDETIWSGSTDELGYAYFFLAFTDKNYSSVSTLLKETYLMELDVVFLSSTPLLLSLSSNNPPQPPDSPTPSDNSTEVAIGSVLTWNCSDPDNDTLTYDVYLDTVDGTTLVASGVNETNYSPDLDYATIYYWKIMADDGVDQNAGSVWSFSTEAEPHAGDWNVSLSVEVGGSSALNATFGMNDGATGGFDADIGDLLLPPGFAGVESYFYYPDNPSSPVNLRKLYVSYLPVEYPANWTFKVHTFTGVSGETTVSWSASDIAGIPSGYYVNLETPTGSVNMREASQYTWTAEDETTYTFTVNIAFGVIIDQTHISDGRVNLGTTQTVSFHGYWMENSSDVTAGTFYVNEVAHTVNSTGWVTLEASRGEVGRLTWTVTGVQCGDVTSFSQNAADPSIIWDRVEVYDGGASPERVGPLVNSTVWFKARYSYDSTVLDDDAGQLNVNGTSCVWSEAGDRWEMDVSRREAGNVTYVVSDVSEVVYDLSGFTDAAGPVTVYFTGEWSASLSVDVAGSSAGIVLGLDGDATTGFDASAGDALVSPAPPSGVSAYFHYPDNPSSPVDLRKLSTSLLPVEYPAEWALKVQTIGVSGDASLNWSSSEIDAIPVNYTVTLDTPSGGVDMRSGDSYSWAADADTTYTFTISITSEVEYTLGLNIGWNMVSIPVIPDDHSAASVLGDVGFFQLVTWSGTGYVAATEFEAGRGYWLLVLEDVNVTVTGIPVDEVTVTLSPGWSMIGGPNSVVQASEVFPGFYQLVTWTGTGYTPATVFEPGKGYWALVLEETQIQLPSA